MLELVFPNAVDRTLYAELLTLSPGYSGKSDMVANPDSAFSHEVTVDDLIQMNIAEIRTRLHHMFQRPVLLGFCPEHSKRKLTGIMDSLLYDETRHIAYTAILIDRLCGDHGSQDIKDLMLERLRDFDDVTRNELKLRVFD